MFKHENGWKAKSIVTGFKGVIIGRTNYLLGCNRYLISPPVNKDGEMGESYWFDEDELKITSKKELIKTKSPETGGPPSKHY